MVVNLNRQETVAKGVLVQKILLEKLRKEKNKRMLPKIDFIFLTILTVIHLLCELYYLKRN